MTTPALEIEPLVAGDSLSRDGFLRRWEVMPEVTKAELIGGVVYMPSTPMKAGQNTKGDAQLHCLRPFCQTIDNRP